MRPERPPEQSIGGETALTPDRTRWLIPATVAAVTVLIALSVIIGRRGEGTPADERALEPGRPASWLNIAGVAMQTGDDSVDAFMGRVFATMGLPEDSASRLAPQCGSQLGQRGAGGEAPCLALLARVVPGDEAIQALLYILSRNGDSAFAAIERGIRQRNENLPLLLGWLERIYGPDPRFDAARRRMGLAGR